MEEGYAQNISISADVRLRDIEERQRLLRDRIILIGETVVNEREKTFKQLQEVKHNLLLLREEHLRMKELLERITEQLQSAARKEELIILQRQFDLFRKT